MLQPGKIHFLMMFTRSVFLRSLVSTSHSHKAHYIITSYSCVIDHDLHFYLNNFAVCDVCVYVCVNISMHALTLFQSHISDLYGPCMNIIELCYERVIL